jgi:hypothetical protein
MLWQHVSPLGIVLAVLPDAASNREISALQPLLAPKGAATESTPEAAGRFCDRTFFRTGRSCDSHADDALVAVLCGAVRPRFLLF